MMKKIKNTLITFLLYMEHTYICYALRYVYGDKAPTWVSRYEFWLLIQSSKQDYIRRQRVLVKESVLSIKR
jgi:hypothetical protein